MNFKAPPVSYDVKFWSMAIVCKNKKKEKSTQWWKLGKHRLQSNILSFALFSPIIFPSIM